MYNILLVDDESAAKMAFCDLLDWDTTPYTIVGTARNGREALDFVQKNKVDILVTDLKMPHMNGLQLIHQLTSENFPGVILVMSNYSDFDLVREALLSGAQDYMLKINMDSASLLAQLERATQKLPRARAAFDGQNAFHEGYPTAQYRDAFFRAYLLAESEPTLPVSAEEQLLSTPPYVLFYIVPEKNSEKALPEKSVKSLLCSIIGEADVLKFPGDEYFCLSSFPANTSRETIQGRATQIVRQLQMYLNRQCAIIFSELFWTAEELKRESARCRETAPALFYVSFPVCLGARTFIPVPLTEPLSPKDATQYLTERFFTVGVKGLENCIDRFLADCSSRSIQPNKVCIYAYQVVQILLLSNSMPTDTSVFSRHAALLTCANTVELKTSLLQLLPVLMENSLPELYQGCHPDVKAVLLCLQYHYTQKFSLSEIASSVNLDKSYLCRLFKKETGQSIFQYLNALRMKRAAEIIIDGSTYVHEVSSAVGIEDPFYFTRLFKKYYGVSPSEFKSQQTS